jgi:hypothetical protein
MSEVRYLTTGCGWRASKAAECFQSEANTTIDPGG